jgi:IS30 family transposase
VHKTGEKAKGRKGKRIAEKGIRQNGKRGKGMEQRTRAIFNKLKTEKFEGKLFESF